MKIEPVGNLQKFPGKKAGTPQIIPQKHLEQHRHNRAEGIAQSRQHPTPPFSGRPAGAPKSSGRPLFPEEVPQSLQKGPQNRFLIIVYSRRKSNRPPLQKPPSRQYCRICDSAAGFFGGFCRF